MFHNKMLFCKSIFPKSCRDRCFPSAFISLLILHHFFLTSVNSLRTRL